MQTQNNILLSDRYLNKIVLVLPMVNLINRMEYGKDIEYRLNSVTLYVQVLADNGHIYQDDVQQVIKSVCQIMAHTEKTNQLRGISLYESNDSYDIIEMPVSSDVSPHGDTYEDM